MMLYGAQFAQKRFTLAFQFRLEPSRAIAITTSPRFRAVFVSALAPSVSIFHLEQVKVFFPVGLLFVEGWIAKASLDPSGDPSLIDSGFFHIHLVLVSRN